MLATRMFAAAENVRMLAPLYNKGARQHSQTTILAGFSNLGRESWQLPIFYRRSLTPLGFLPRIGCAL